MRWPSATAIYNSILLAVSAMDLRGETKGMSFLEIRKEWGLFVFAALLGKRRVASHFAGILEGSGVIFDT
ncbi:hypothetical protein L6452_14801 [Arctium lappa]|uniref:Uncharacterized protein n=1 Tax=Arctium lappa TaxID=4217 RepID=A0ACB9CM08_ARCLA|nr:hypothetical protein L6452_14801 [Arctium lappa]